MKERADQSMELMDKLAALTQAKQREKEKFEAHLSRQQEESRRVQEKLVTENSVSLFYLKNFFLYYCKYSPVYFRSFKASSSL